MSQEDKIEIEKLDFPDNVRTRPGMYVGELDNPGFILREVVDNSMDELMASKRANTVVVNQLERKFLLVADNGRGIPIEMDLKHNQTKTELAMSSLNAGSKFNKTSAQAGMNGVGASCTNALSEEFIVMSKVTKENQDKSIPEVLDSFKKATLDGSDTDLYYVIVFNKGVKAYEGCKTIKECEEEMGFEFKLPNEFKASTITLFLPDASLYDTISCEVPTSNIKYLRHILRNFHSKEATFIINGKEFIEDVELLKYNFRADVTPSDTEKNEKVEFHVSFEFSEDLSDRLSKGCVNSLVVNRGIHISFVETILKNSLKDKYKIYHNHLSPGLLVFITCVAPEVDFSSQTKENLRKVHGLKPVDMEQIRKKVYQIFKENDEEIKLHVDKLNEYASAMENIKVIDKVKSMVNISKGEGDRSRSFLPNKLRDASSKKRTDCELLIVEGDSAGGIILQARDPKFHALLPLRGVPVNAANLNYENLFDNEEMKDLISTIGLGINEYHDTSNPRYGKVIICADSDPDGANISSLVLGAIAKHMTFLIDEEMVYVAEGPLYQQDGKYIYPSDNIEEKLNRENPFKRFKGLGELNVDDADNCFINKDQRRLLRITRDNIDEALLILISSGHKRKLMVESGIITNPYGV